MSTSNQNNSIGVNHFIEQLDMSTASIVSAIRQTILDIDPMIDEQIKWNSPSFFYKGEMKEFDPKTYQRDIAVINVRKGIMLVLPTGASIKENTKILEGNYTDGRRIIKFSDLEDVETKKTDLQNALKEWLNLIPKKV